MDYRKSLCGNIILKGVLFFDMEVLYIVLDYALVVDACLGILCEVVIFDSNSCCSGGIMHQPEAIIALLVFLVVVIFPLVLLMLQISILNRQKQDSQETTQLLEQLRSSLKQTNRLVRQLTEGVPASVEPKLQPQKELPAAEQPIAAEAVEPEPAAEPIAPSMVVEPVPKAESKPEAEPLVPSSIGEPQSVPDESPSIYDLFPPDIEQEAVPVVFDSQTAHRRAEPDRFAKAAQEAMRNMTQRREEEPSRFEKAAQEALRKIWNWIVIGKDQLAEDESWEYAVASNWLLRIGIVIIVMGVGFFLKYSIDNGYINEIGRVLLTTIAGLGMLTAGTQMLGRKYHLFGQGLIGGGIATLYFAVFAATSLYHLIDAGMAFGLMVLVTCLAGWIAVRFNSILVAVLGIIGGYGTPVMLQTGVVNFPGLFSYLLILGIGVLGISYWKNWRLLNLLSFLGTYGLFFAVMDRWHYNSTYFWQVMPFLTAFFVLFSTMTFLFNLANRQKSTLLEVLALWVNAGIFFVVGYNLVSEIFGSRSVAVISLSLATFYAAHVYYFLLRKLVDRELMLSFTALASFFVAVTLPLILSSQWITASWAIQALIMLWIAGKLDSQFLRHIAYLLYVFVIFRFGLIDLRDQYFRGMALATLPVADYLWCMVQRLVMFSIPMVSLAGAGVLLRRAPPSPTMPVGRENDMGQWVKEHSAIQIIAAVVVGMLFLFIHLELGRTLQYFYQPLQMPALSLVWIALCVFLLREYRRRPSEAFQGLLMVFTAGLVAKLFMFDLASWQVIDFMLYGGDCYSFSLAAMRLLDFGAIIAFLGATCYLLSGSENSRSLGAVYGAVALALLFIFTTLETNTFLRHYVPGLRAGGVSILWSIFALSLILSGIWRNVRTLRYVGLALFGIVVWKVMFSDLAQLDQLYRIVAFIVLGILVLSGSFVYLKYKPVLAAISKEKE